MQHKAAQGYVQLSIMKQAINRARPTAQECKALQ